MQRTVVTTAQRQLPDLIANSLLSSLISGNAAMPLPHRRAGQLRSPSLIQEGGVRPLVDRA